MEAIQKAEESRSLELTRMVEQSPVFIDRGINCNEEV